MRDITSQVRFEDPDGETLPVTRCACGREFTPWNFMIGIYASDPYACPACGRRMVFRNSITVYELEEGE